SQIREVHVGHGTGVKDIGVAKHELIGGESLGGEGNVVEVVVGFKRLRVDVLGLPPRISFEHGLLRAHGLVAANSELIIDAAGRAQAEKVVLRAFGGHRTRHVWLAVDRECDQVLGDLAEAAWRDYVRDAIVRKLLPRWRSSVLLLLRTRWVSCGAACGERIVDRGADGGEISP